MKKISKILLMGLSLFTFIGCGNPVVSEETASASPSESAVSENPVEFSAIMPNGTPSLGLASFINGFKDSCEIVNGSDPLVAAFTNKSKDIIVAPVNLGAKLYNSAKSTYQLYETFVWGNLYLASYEEIPSFASLDGKSVTVFSKNSTPDIVMQTIISHYNINVTLNYVDDVTTANSQLSAGTADVIVSAEPSLSKMKSVKTVYTLDLQEEYAKATGSKSYPQAGIFVEKDKTESLKGVLIGMKESVNYALENPSDTAKDATEIYSAFATMGESVLASSIPNCHFGFSDNQKTDIETYFAAMDSIGLGAQHGGKMPDEGFYFTI